MTQSNSSTGLNACTSVCWLLAFAFGIFVAAALIGWAGWHGLVAAVIGLIAMLIAGWLLKGIFCTAEIPASGVTTSTAVAAASATAVVAAEKEKPAAKKTAAKSVPAAKTKTAAAKKPAVKKATASKAKPAAKKTVAAQKPEAKKSAAKKAPTKFYKKPPAKIDDLKLISGVGPKLEATLNQIGIYQYDQVAAWKKTEIKKVDDQLKFKGRIERDDWMAQAKILAKGGDTEFSKKKRKT